MHVLFNRINFVECLEVYSIAEKMSIIPCELVHGINSSQLHKELLVKEMEDGSIRKLTEIVCRLKNIAVND